jgi:hypothetical protein
LKTFYVVAIAAILSGPVQVWGQNFKELDLSGMTVILKNPNGTSAQYEGGKRVSAAENPLFPPTRPKPPCQDITCPGTTPTPKPKHPCVGPACGGQTFQLQFPNIVVVENPANRHFPTTISQRDFSRTPVPKTDF